VITLRHSAARHHMPAAPQCDAFASRSAPLPAPRRSKGQRAIAAARSRSINSRIQTAPVIPSHFAKKVSVGDNRRTRRSWSAASARFAQLRPAPARKGIDCKPTHDHDQHVEQVNCVNEANTGDDTRTPVQGARPKSLATAPTVGLLQRIRQAGVEEVERKLIRRTGRVEIAIVGPRC